MMRVVDVLGASRVLSFEDAIATDITWSARRLEDMWCNHEHGGDHAVSATQLSHSDDGQ